MPRISEQVEWLSLVDISGPFLAPALLEQVFPQGLEKVETPRRQRIRSAYEEWRDAVDEGDTQLLEIHAAWVFMVLQDMLEYEDSVLMSRRALDGRCSYRAPESGTLWVPDYAIVGDDGKYRMLVSIWPPETDLEKVASRDSWLSSPLDRMTLLCRANDVRLGLVTDGERWMVVNAPVGSTSGYAAWLARLWWQEPVTLKAFQSLLGVRRCFGPNDDTLAALLTRSTDFQEEVTDTLGEQVRRAVEILVQAIGRADQDRNGALLESVRPAELYEAGLTVMMRMVFTLCAEERDLLLLGDPIYDQYYAISTLRARLREDADRFGLEVLERRHDAWSRILAVFRAIYGGVEHEALRMPAMGGSLFDPDRFPFLEGRAKGTTWREGLAVPLPIDNRTVLLLLDALQVLEQRAGAQLLSYRALDVEQIGHVYEGLLEYTVAKLDKVTVGLLGSQKVRHPSIALAELESLNSDGREKSIETLAEMTGRTAAAIRRALDNSGGKELLVSLIHACDGDENLARRLLPFVQLIRSDSWGTMLVYKPGSFAIVHGSDRRETGTHYTPKSLTESIVEKTLEPIVYTGPAEGEAREHWKLKTPAEILDLKVCDPAMGSGAFLVQVCRYLAERLVEAWAQEECAGKAITSYGIVIDTLGMADPLPDSPDERLIAARRLIAERCLYGVDINPLAVELAKLSIWLVTMAKGRPFGFLDHNLRSGDSLLGIHHLDQLTKLTVNPDKAGHQQRLFGQNIGNAVKEAVAIRAKLRAVQIRDIRDIEMMARLNTQACKNIEAVELIADAMIGTILAKSGQPRTINSSLDLLAVEASDFLNGNTEVAKRLAHNTLANLSLGLSEARSCRRPIHWPLVFPEVFCFNDAGFNAVVGNPPFAEGEAFVDCMRAYFKCFYDVQSEESAQGQPRTSKINLVTLFIERFMKISTKFGHIGFVAPKPLLRNERYWRCRMVMLHRAAIRYIFNLPPGFFRSASVETCAIVCSPLSESKTTDSYEVIAYGLGLTPARLYSASILADKLFTIRIESSASSIDLINRLSEENGVLCDQYETRDGINPGRKDFRSIFLGRKEEKYFIPLANQGNASHLPHPLAAPEPFNETIHKPTINGRDFSAYSVVNWDGTYLRYTSDVAYLEDFFVKGTRWSAQLREKENYDREEKVISRQTADTLIATLDRIRLFPLNTVHVHYPKSVQGPYSCKLLLALLNSKLLRFFYRAKSEETGTVFPQVHISAIRILPLPRRIHQRIVDQIESLVRTALNNGSSTETLTEIDEIIYGLYNVTAGERRFIEAYHTEGGQV